MYLCEDIIADSLKKLQEVHPFFLITFLAYKEFGLPIVQSETQELADTRNVEREFMEKYYRPAKEFDGFFRPSRVSDKAKMWVPRKYPDAGLQSIRTRNDKITVALLHNMRGGYGWSENYVKKLKLILNDNERLPAFYIAVWLYREKDWGKSPDLSQVIVEFTKQFKITPEEERILFDVTLPKDIAPIDVFCDKKINWPLLRKIIGNYPRAPLEEGGLLKSLSITGVGPIKNLLFEPLKRLNIIAGDNGLGKTFLLDCVWWALSGNWAGKQINPHIDARWSVARIQYEISSYNEVDLIRANYDWERLSWITDKRRRILPGLLIYARIDNSFAIWDPAKFTLFESIRQSGEQLNLANFIGSVNPADFHSGQLVLSEKEVRDGKQSQSSLINDNGRFLCNGIIRDWITWSNDNDLSAFETFTTILKKLSPPGFKPIVPGKPVRTVTDSRPIPTIKLPYGEVLLTDVSAGIGRIIELAYLITWVWEEHKTISAQIKKAPQERMIILVDEMESHLHPKWQRTIIPALMDVINLLSEDLQIQFIIATHSPLVLTSSEPFFNDEIDRLFYLDLQGETIKLKNIDFEKYGKVDNWLQSDVFGLKQARSVGAEEAIQKAIAIQLQDKPDPDIVRRIHSDLQKTLPDFDEFWPRWIYFARKNGVII